MSSKLLSSLAFVAAFNSATINISKAADESVGLTPTIESIGNDIFKCMEGRAKYYSEFGIQGEKAQELQGREVIFIDTEKYEERIDSYVVKQCGKEIQNKNEATLKELANGENVIFPIKCDPLGLVEKEEKYFLNYKCRNTSSGKSFSYDFEYKVPRQ